MKIKTDFVTNSSSTAYIVVIPNNFKLLESVAPIEKTDSYKEAFEYQCHSDEKFMLDSVNETIETLKEGYQVYIGNVYAFYVARDYLRSKGAIIKDIDMIGNSVEDIMEPITLEDIHKALNRIQKNEIEN
jgi:hypothetical protein